MASVPLPDLERGIPSPTSSPSTTRLGTTLIAASSQGIGSEQEKGPDSPLCAPRHKWGFDLLFRRHEAHETICRTLESCPNGYPRLAAFLASDQNFTQYRCFSYLHNRVLLDYQDQLAVLERELDQLDQDDNTSDRCGRLESRATDNHKAKAEGQVRPRRAILAEINEKLMQYDQVLIHAREIALFQRPSERDYRSVRTWFDNNNPLVAQEQEFVACKEDIVALRHGRECAGFDSLVESALRKINCSLIRWLFCTKELRQKTSNQYIRYFSPSRVDKLVGLIITSVIFVLLVAPVVTMYKLTTFGNRNTTFKAIGVLIVFTLVFSAAMSLLTRARRHELFAASAAYCAVLVVFISNFGTET